MIYPLQTVWVPETFLYWKPGEVLGAKYQCARKADSVSKPGPVRGVSVGDNPTANPQTKYTVAGILAAR
jgi:hypothetical protein